MINYNPDVLSCLANLSNDEVFTPPEIANRMLDLLPKEIWSDSKVKFLDPFCKSGVFLREITKRLLDGLSEEIPDMQERLDHILHHQVYGMAITELTSLVSRRSLYCSKDASSEYSISRFDEASGNIAFHEIPHTWNESTGKCIYCGASREVYERGEDKESHAYQFIHTDNPKELFNNMKFDVIIGNPPYQLDDGGNNASATPIYNLFVEQAKKLSPAYLIMIIPSRWYCGGRGLDSFREAMLTDVHLKLIYDFQRAKDCFPGIRNGGGICYFLLDSHYNSSDVCIINHGNDKNIEMIRPKLEFGFDFFIRDSRVRNIVSKIMQKNEDKVASRVFRQKPYGFRTNFTGYTKKGEVKLYTKKEKCGYGYVKREEILKNEETIDKWKVVTSRSTSVPEEDNGQVLRMSQTFIVEPNAVVTESYIVIDVFDDRAEAENFMSYVKTKFFRILCQVMIVSPDVSKRTFNLVPLQDFSHPWTDEMLYRKYKLSSDEIAFIESMIRPME